MRIPVLKGSEMFIIIMFSNNTQSLAHYEVIGEDFVPSSVM